MRIRMRYGAPLALAAVIALALVGVAVAAPNGNSSSLQGSGFRPQAAEDHVQGRGADRPHPCQLRPSGIGPQGGTRIAPRSTSTTTAS